MYKILTEVQFEKPVKTENNPTYEVKKHSSHGSISSISSTRVSSRRHSANSSKESLSKKRSSKNLSHSKSKLNSRKNSYKNVFFVIGKKKVLYNISNYFFKI